MACRTAAKSRVADATNTCPSLWMELDAGHDGFAATLQPASVLISAFGLGMHVVPLILQLRDEPQAVVPFAKQKLVR